MTSKCQIYLEYDEREEERWRRLVGAGEGEREDREDCDDE